MMKTMYIGSILVKDVNGSKTIGLLSERDIINKVVATDLKPSSITIGKIIPKKIVTVDAHNDIVEVANVLGKNRFKVVMVKDKGEFVGIISTTDVLAITPDALDVLVGEVRVGENYNAYKKNIAEGTCENCGRYEEELIEINGQFLCDECKNELEAG